ncbi:hypothetical protein [Cellulomonas sp. B6]|uniref:hypothetical protein n=1 Tax=Cellulomonas sp. B6 TaxID=1295626 RepID=UPI00073C6C9C|nr:hypothetical protein [Cellulomonas sp. B6]KSW29532.1 hypothetical protein ATM99_00420 [Cellulomonas sp. B6]
MPAPRPSRSRCRSAAVLTLATLVVAACGEPSEAPADDPAGTRPTAAAVAGADAPQLQTPTDRTLPFTAYRSAIETLTNPDAATAAERERFEAVEVSIAACMGTEGFDYAPREYERPETLVASWADDAILLPLLPDDRDRVATVGYGVDDVEAQEAELEATETPDRNAEHLAALGPSAQSAYVKALTGADGPDGESSTGAGGCAGRAQTQHPAPVDDRPDFSDLIRSMRELVQDDVFQAPEALALAEEWNSCMLDGGVDVAPPDSYGPVQRPGPLQAYELALATRADGTVAWPSRDTPTRDVPVDSRYLVGSVAERAIALADLDCRERTDYAARLTDVVEGLQRAFVAAHADELARLTSAAAVS